MAITSRIGLEADLDKNKLRPGERVTTLDTGKSYFCSAPGVVKEQADKTDIANVQEQIDGINQTTSDLQAKDQELQAQINQIVKKGDSSVEAAQARTNADGKTFDVLKDRLDDSDAKKATYYDLDTQTGTALHFDRADDRGVAEIVKIAGASYQDVSVWGTNLLTNGNFVSTAGWAGEHSTLSYSGGVLSATGKDSAFYARAAQITNHDFITGHKIYCRYMCRVTNTDCVKLINYIYDGINAYSVSISAPVQNTWYTFSNIIAITTGSANKLRFLSDHWYASDQSALGKTMEVKYAICLDLTEIFGAGKEPTAIQMDTMLSAYTNSWFDGKGKLTNDTTTYTPNSPSIDYPAPITNAGLCNLIATGKNMADNTKVTGTFTQSGITITNNGDGSFTCNGTSTSGFGITLCYGMTFGDSVVSAVYDAISNGANVQVVKYPVVSGITAFPLSISNGNKSFSYNGQVAIRLQGGSAGIVFNNFTIRLQLEPGTVATPYETYMSDQFSMQNWEMPSTTRGVRDAIEKDAAGDTWIVARCGKGIFDGSPDEGWTLQSINDYGIANFWMPLNFSGAMDLNSALCSHFKEQVSLIADTTTPGFLLAANNMLCLRIPQAIASDAAGLRALLAANPITVIYELATPIYTKIDNIYLKSYLDNTNIFTDAALPPTLTINMKSALWNYARTQVSKSDLVSTDQVNDSSKVPTSGVTYALGQEIDGINTLINGKKIRSGRTSVTFTSGVANLTHSCGFAPATYVLLFIPEGLIAYNSINVDGNITTIYAKNFSGTNLADFSGTIYVKWIAVGY